MLREEINKKLNKQNQVFKDKVHSLIAEHLGINELYTESNLWCEITKINLLHDESITISGSTFTYQISLKGHEIISYNFRLEVNNAPNYKKITKGDIESHSTDIRGRVETTNNILKAIFSVKEKIIEAFEEYINYDFNLKEEK